MAHGNSTPDSDPVKTKGRVSEGSPELVSDNVSKAVISKVKDLTGQPTGAGGFTKVYHFYESIMSRTEGAFFQDLVRLTSLKKAKYEDDSPNVRFYLCTKSFLTKSGMKWTYQEQRYNLTSLAKKGFITLRMQGPPKRRWVCIEWDVVAKALLVANGGSADQWQWRLGSKPPDWTPAPPKERRKSTPPSGTKPPVRDRVGVASCGKPQHPYCGFPQYPGAENRNTQLHKTAPPTCGEPQPKEKKRGDDMIGDWMEEETLSRTAPAASPPPGDGTVCISDPQPKQPTATPAIEADTDDNYDTSPPPSSASPPPSRETKRIPTRDVSWMSNLELEEEAIFAADMKERDEHGRKKRKFLRRRNSS